MGSLGKASIAASGAEYVVTVTNAYCPGNGWTDSLEVVMMDIDGMRVTLQIWSEPGMVPDAFVVLPPPGWLADPESLTVDEYKTGIVRVTPIGLS